MVFKTIQEPLSSDVLEEMPDALLEQLAIEASQDAVGQLLSHGISVFYFESDILIREDPSGQRFEIKRLESKRGAYQIVRELQ